MNTRDINHRIASLKLLERFSETLGSKLYRDNDNAWAFCALLYDIIYTTNPTKDRHAIVYNFPQRDIHFNRKAVLSAIAKTIDQITDLVHSDPVLAESVSALLE